MQGASQQQQFNRTIEDIELWLGEIEGQLLSEDYGKDLTSVQNLQKKHVLHESDVVAHQDRIDKIKVAANKFVEGDHFDADNIRNKNAILSNYPGANTGEPETCEIGNINGKFLILL